MALPLPRSPHPPLPLTSPIRRPRRLPPIPRSSPPVRITFGSMANGSGAEAAGSGWPDIGDTRHVRMPFGLSVALGTMLMACITHAATGAEPLDPASNGHSTCEFHIWRVHFVEKGLCPKIKHPMRHSVPKPSRSKPLVPQNLGICPQSKKTAKARSLRKIPK